MTRTRSGDAAAPARDEDGSFPRGAVTRIEAFVDAAFAFAITRMVISIDEIPDRADALEQKLKAISACAARLLLIALFWRGHADCSRLTGQAMLRWTIIALFLLALAAWMPQIPGMSWRVTLPACIFFGLHLLQMQMPIQQRRILAGHGLAGR